MTNNVDFSAMINGLRDELSKLDIQRAEIDAKYEAIEQAIFGLRKVSEVTAPANQAFREHMSVQKSVTTTISPRSPKSPTYGSFAGRYTIAPQPPAKPDHGPMPEGARENWVSIIAANASPFALALAVIRSHKGDTITSPEINSALIELRGIEGGAGYTVLEPLQKAGVIEGNHKEWKIKDRSRGGFVSGEFLWCDPKYLNIYDWAAIRREAVHILLAENKALTNAAITKSLESCEWIEAVPLTPHLIKADMRQMASKNLAVQDAVSKTWSLTEHGRRVLRFQHEETA
jgi:hypothetical protein